MSEMRLTRTWPPFPPPFFLFLGPCVEVVQDIWTDLGIFFHGYAIEVTGRSLARFAKTTEFEWRHDEEPNFGTLAQTALRSCVVAAGSGRSFVCTYIHTHIHTYIHTYVHT